MAAYLLQRLVGRPARTKPIGAILEICFEDRLQDQQGRHLDHSVAHRRDAQRPHFPIRLWSVDAPYRFRRVGLGAQRLLDFVQEPLHTGFRRFNLLDRYAIHPGRALIGTYPFPTRFQHIAPIDPVVQHIKPELRFLLGLLAQLLSQQREFVWGSVSAHLFLQGFDMLPFFRSGNLFQVVLLSSYSSNASSEAPWLHGRYPASSLLWASPTPGQGRSLGYVFPRAVGGRLPFPRPAGSPRFLDCSIPARLSPTTPEGPASACSLLPRRCQASSTSGGLATSSSVTRPNRVRLRYGSQVCFPGFHQPDYSDSLRFRYMHERAIYMVNSFQFTRSARLSLVYPMNADKIM